MASRDQPIIGGKFRKRPVTSVLQAFTHQQLGFRSYQHIWQLPSSVMEMMDEKLSKHGMPQLLSKINELSRQGKSKHKELLEFLKMLLKKLSNLDCLRRAYSEGSSHDVLKENCQIILDFDGINLILEILMNTATLPWSKYSSCENSEELLIKNVCLDILRRFFLLVEKFGEKLPYTSDILNYLFTLLVYPNAHVNAAHVLELILNSHKEMLDLNTVPNLKELISVMDDKALSNFCQILSVTISDLDTYEHKSSLYQQNKQKRSKGFFVMRDINQECLMSIPDLLPRLVHIVETTPYQPRYPAITNELDTWMQWIDNQMAEEDESVDVESSLDDFIGDSVNLYCDDPQSIMHHSLKMATHVIHRVEVFYVLGLFLVGKQRKKVQKQLAELKLIPTLADIFDNFIWKCTSGKIGTRRLRGHNSSCECSPEVALKIQFLRLVHSLCDHSEHKHLLLSRTELTELKKLNEGAGKSKVENFDVPDKSLMCRGTKGLLTKIVEVLKKEPTASTFRFWLARAVESYLRGSTCYADQMFLLRRGLLHHVAGNLIENDVRPKEILQSSFDLLGELIKFNADAFRQFERVVCTDVKFKKLVEMIERNLVDSNMFIRSLILSLEHLQTEMSTEYNFLFQEENRLLEYICNFKQQVSFLQRLITIINVKSLTQENVSCLNTALVFLMFAHKNGKMNSYLAALKQCAVRVGEKNLLANFRDLLVFWQDHYLHKDKDCSALEKSSRIKFETWKDTVTMMLSTDQKQGTSIVHYLPEHDLPRDN
ncbi:PREDICTED: short transient receptor potential channel 4-associated protein-like isoform X2 [Priapulus caudatus]|nr:PREDICTED: short transient receptor potential channel 4-associated protein-like isoform X2 [Priapulus caudatus]